MSTAILSLESEKLEGQCNWVVEVVERRFAHYALTDTPNRMTQLTDILHRCILFKHKLECQGDTYAFWCSKHQTPFRGEQMRCVEEQESSGGLVDLSLWPCLYKDLSGDEWAIVEKEVVKKFGPMTSLAETTDDEASHLESEDLLEL
jgi:hypothetical protein